MLAKICTPEPPPEDAWTGRADPYESGRFVGWLLDRLTGRTDCEAIAGLERLIQDRGLKSWHNHLLNHAEQQRRKIREERHRKPPLEAIVRVLASGPPATVADLQALTVDHLRNLFDEMRNGRANSYLTFWNLDGYGNPESPIPENSARDRLLDRLRPLLAPVAVTADPEVPHAGGRADFRIAYGALSLPVEVKRNYNAEIWTAPKDQLKTKYAIDPAAEGYGIYLVFWFGEVNGRRTKRPPAGISQPASANDLEAALRRLYSGEEWRKIEFLCFDCSPRDKGRGRARRPPPSPANNNRSTADPR